MDNKLVDKIQKLLALANSSNENEAKAAANKANELLLKHNIDLATVEASDKDYETFESEAKARQSSNSKYVDTILAKYFFVKIIHKIYGKRNCRVTYVGEKSNLKIALYMKEFLSQAFVNSWETYRDANNLGVSAKESYFIGFFKGISEQLDATKTKVEQQYGLVVTGKDPELDAYIKNGFGKLKSASAAKVSVNDRNALEAGRQNGANLALKKGVETTNTTQSKTLLLG